MLYLDMNAALYWHERRESKRSQSSNTQRWNRNIMPTYNKIGQMNNCIMQDSFLWVCEDNIDVWYCMVLYCMVWYCISDRAVWRLVPSRFGIFRIYLDTPHTVSDSVSLYVYSHKFRYMFTISEANRLGSDKKSIWHSIIHWYWGCSHCVLLYRNHLCLPGKFCASSTFVSRQISLLQSRCAICQLTYKPSSYKNHFIM